MLLTHFEKHACLLFPSQGMTIASPLESAVMAFPVFVSFTIPCFWFYLDGAFSDP
jgi:hypothetical protein